MIIAWIIGLFLSLLGIYLLKGSRHSDKRNYYGQVVTPSKPILKVWSLLLLLLGAIMPIFNIGIGLFIIVFWYNYVYIDKDWVCTKGSKIISFLNKPIK